MPEFGAGIVAGGRGPWIERAFCQLTARQTTLPVPKLHASTMNPTVRPVKDCPALARRYDPIGVVIGVASMALYLSLCEVGARADEVRAAFEKLLASPRLSARRASQQWRFLRGCFERLLDPTVEEMHVEARKAAQYKFEIEKRLARYYQAAGPALVFVFLLMDRAVAVREDLIDEDYPSSSGYALLVSHAHLRAALSADKRELQEYFVRLIEDAARAEFAAYAAVPEVRLASLDGVFVPNGPAYRRIRNVVEQNALKGWTIRHPEYNPSTMRVLSVRVGEVTDTQATMFTEEYWYLRWWSMPESRYAYIYNETNHQRYVLTRVGARWLIDANIYPPPRATAATGQLRTRTARR